MNVEYDIFATFADSGPIWIESVQGLEVAKQRVATMLKRQPGDYWIYDMSRGQVVFTKGYSAN